ncbi:GDPD-domain-containing protein [Nadsonia fulvescens var. elongata DSM 6958]|uniref:GDPD-domain-containing protein n=1 Tax=Nadsonia fulvescens var. elongata DSM 6958 TaxID=857566 RepID=A0A1E3PQD9_9ASCO|nr:GDPD-domain-containing protein [Nadsonia fulvescens var. elongata DSM 6958]
MVLITLGSSDTRESLKSIELNLLSLPNLHNTGLDTALSLMISATNTDDEPTILDLPIHDEIQCTEPISFSTSDHSLKDVRVMFDIVPTYSIAPKKVLGRAVALIPSLSKNFTTHRRSLISTMTIPIVQLETLDFLGTINFEFLIIKPFHHPKMGVEKSHTYWKTLSTNPVIGHRGNGMNLTDKRSLQLGENTLESFIAASNLGASYVELDVQLTKDMKPVIYHDFLVSETGFDCPVHALTLEQFLAIKSQDKRYMNEKLENSKAILSLEDSLAVSEVFVDNNLEPTNPSESSTRVETPYHNIKTRIGRSLSLQSFSDPTREWKELMKNTRDFKNKGFKPNSRGLTITSPFTTLLEVLTTLPKSIGINIECKYPMLDESQQEDMEAYAIELNSWVDTVLEYVYEHGEGRDILLSSFHPDVCIMLVMKQPSIPVLFLTEAGVNEMADIRARSLQEAIRFAKRWNLLGIIPDSKAIITCPRLVKVVKQSGLMLFTYGHLNSKPELASLQIKYGVDAVISDSVLGVRKELRAV